MAATTAPRRTVASVQKEFDAFKASVVEMAMTAKEEHGWCNEVDNMLEQLGLEVPQRKATVTIVLDDLSQYEENIGADPLDDDELAEQIKEQIGMGSYYSSIDGSVKAVITSA